MRRVSDIFAALAFASILALIAWLFSLHGTRGLIHIERLFGVGLLLMAILGLIPLVLAAIRRYARTKATPGPRFSTPITVLSMICILISLFGFGFVGGFPPRSVGDTVPRIIMVAGTGSNGIPDVAVVAESASEQRYSLSWGATKQDSVIQETNASKEHVFVLRDLDPATQYHYRLNQGPQYEFRTPDPSSGLRFAVGSDAHFDTPGSRNDLTRLMLTQIADPANRFDYFFSLGDNVEFGFRPEQWRMANEGLTRASSIVPSTYAAGNHDTMFTGLNRYLDFAYPSATGVQNGSRLWHRIDVGNVHFLVLDIEWSAETFTKDQADWLESELKSIPTNDWTIVMNHGFYYASGSVTRGWKWYDNYETISRVTPLFEKYGVDLVFSGHAHQMELLQKSGVTYIIDGAFGGPPDSPREYTSPESIWYSSGNYGYVDVTVDDSSATILFKDSSGTVLERAVVPK